MFWSNESLHQAIEELYVSNMTLCETTNGREV